MPKHGKNFRKVLEGSNLQERFSIEDAVSKSLGASFAKFDETVDVAVRLGVDPKYSDQMVRGAVTLPHGLGKTVRVAVFCKGEKQAEAREAGADVVGAEDLVQNAVLAVEDEAPHHGDGGGGAHQGQEEDSAEATLELDLGAEQHGHQQG